MPRFAPALVVAVVGLASLVGVTSASAASSYPAPPTGVHLVSVGGTAFTVAANRSANVKGYRLYASPVKDDLYVDRLVKTRATRKAATATSPRVTVRGLAYGAVPMYWRFATVNGAHMRVSDIGTTYLRPTAPTSVRLATGSKGTYLTWSSVRATGFVITQATDQAMTQNLRTYTIRGQNSQFTPYDLRQGQTYYFRLRALNGSTGSSYSAIVSGAPTTSEQSVRVLQYNILSLSFDGKPTTGERIASWNSGRKQAAAALIAPVNADVIALEEGASWTNGYKSTLQADSLRLALGRSYSLARTETPTGQPGDPGRTGDYIVYNNTRYRAIGWGGHWSIGDNLFAVYQRLQNIFTGATFLAVVTHLRSCGNSASCDSLHITQTRAVVTKARSLAAGFGNLPVVYAGDFNSYNSDYHPTDGPARVMHPARITEAWEVAQTRTNQTFNSENLYERKPPTGLGAIDRIFGEPGVALRTWTELLRLSRGKFAGVIPSDHNPVLSDVSVPYTMGS